MACADYPASVAGTYLDRIIAAHRALAQVDARDEDEMFERALRQPGVRGFKRAILSTRASDEVAVIAEVKRRSPSKGNLNESLNPSALATTYEHGGATCMSVLTDVEFFGGSPADLIAARDACALPVLRKDFTVSRLDVIDARLMGADAVLLIVAVLSDGELGEFTDLARQLGMDALVEVHDEAELERALAVGADIVGVNQRDLVTFEVDTERAVRLAPRIPSDVVSAAESGIRGPGDARVLAEAGFDALLVGETLVTSDDPIGMLRSLRRPH